MIEMTKTGTWPHHGRRVPPPQHQHRARASCGKIYLDFSEKKTSWHKNDQSDGPTLVWWVGQNCQARPSRAGWGPAQSSSRNPKRRVPFPTKYQQDLVLYCYLSWPCVAWGGPASCWKSLNISFRSGFWTFTWYEGCSWLCWGDPRQGGPLQRDSLRRCCPPLFAAFRLSSSSASP